MRIAILIGATLILTTMLGGCPYVTSAAQVFADIETSLGTITVELDPINAPITVANFRQYATDDFYNNTIFHRVAPDFIIQAGGYTSDLTLKETRAPIQNESDNGLSNTRGTIAMARTGSPDSATSQFFFNLEDNSALDATVGQLGYAVFGEVTAGLDIVDTIAAVQAESRDGFDNLPVEPVIIHSVTIRENDLGPRLSPAGEQYVDSFPTRTARVLRDIAVDVVSWAIYPGF